MAYTGEEEEEEAGRQATTKTGLRHVDNGETGLRWCACAQGSGSPQLVASSTCTGPRRVWLRVADTEWSSGSRFPSGHIR